MKFKKFSKFIFSKFNLCLSSNKKTVYYLKKLGAKNIKYFGNLKYAQSENEKIFIENHIRKFFSKKKSLVCIKYSLLLKKYLLAKFIINLKKN